MVPAWAARIAKAALALALLVGLASLLLPATARALDVPPRPTDIPVVDQTGTLTGEQKQALAKRIADERQATGNQIAVLMVKSLEGQAIEDYSLAVARDWGVGQKERNSGVLLLVAKDDRRMRIEVGYGLEGALTDIRSGQIIRDRIAPKFREGKYYEGLNEGLSGIITAIHGEKDPNLKPETASRPDGSGFPAEALFWGIFIIPAWLGSMLARTKSWWLGGVLGAVGGIIIGIFMGFVFIGIAAIAILTILGLLFDRAVSANYHKRTSRNDTPSWWAGGPWIGGGGAGGSGGFGGFGGGSFGGGGSSGKW